MIMKRQGQATALREKQTVQPQPQKSSDKNTLRVIPLGGIEEVGENMTIMEYGDDILVIDMGLGFPDETMPGIDSLSVNITQDIHVNASIETTFEALLEQLGPENETPERRMPMKLEAWPGGRWYRDLGDGRVTGSH